MRDKGNHVERLQSRYKGMQGGKKWWCSSYASDLGKESILQTVIRSWEGMDYRNGRGDSVSLGPE